MKSTVKFTTNYSQTHVTFFYTKVKFNNGKLVTELYAKSSASFQYLHRTSYHPPHTFRAITKSQFIRIRRICTTLEDYWAHATIFISFFKSRGFNESTLNKTAKEITSNPRPNFLHHNRNSLTQELIQSRKSERISLVTNWTHKLSGFQRILQYHCNEMVNEFSNLKCVFPDLPYYRIVAVIAYLTYWSVLVLFHILPIDLHLTVHHVYLNGAKAANSAI